MSNNPNSCLILKLADLGEIPHYTYRWCSGETMLHKHTDFYELILVTSGEFIHRYQNNTEIIKKGDLLIFDMKQKHRLSSSSPDSIHFTLCLSSEYFHMLMNSFSFFTSIFKNSKYHLVSLDDISFSYLHMLTNRLQSSTSEFDEIKLFFYNALSSILHTGGKSQQDDDDCATDIYIKIKNLSYLTLSLSDIYKKYPYSTPTIIKEFKKLTGVTPMQFQTTTRLEHAARQLRESTLSIDDIFFNLGFHAPSHFYRLFKTHYHLTPNEYRKKYQETRL